MVSKLYKIWVVNNDNIIIKIIIIIISLPIPCIFIFNRVVIIDEGNVERQYPCSANASDNSVWWLPIYMLNY